MPTLMRPSGRLTNAHWDTPTNRSRHRSWKRWLLPLLAALVLVPLALVVVPLLLGPSRLADVTLSGIRNPGCIRLLIAADTSGSMTALAQPRDRAIDQLLAWVPSNLRPDDEIALVQFAGSANMVIPPTPVTEPFTPRPAAEDPGGTNLAPLLDLIEGLEPSHCDNALLIMGDGHFGDLPADEETARTQLSGISTLALLIPGKSDTPTNWTQLYPYAPPTRFDGTNPDATALAIGNHIANLTGQTLDGVS